LTTKRFIHAQKRKFLFQDRKIKKTVGLRHSPPARTANHHKTNSGKSFGATLEKKSSGGGPPAKFFWFAPNGGPRAPGGGNSAGTTTTTSIYDPPFLQQISLASVFGPFAFFPRNGEISSVWAGFHPPPVLGPWPPWKLKAGKLPEALHHTKKYLRPHRGSKFTQEVHRCFLK